jgi:4-amino-4-deoxy-L-arabinose transferase-like glycosyltransferase
MHYALCSCSMYPTLHRLTPLLLYLCTFALAALFAVRTPDWQAPDEPAHYAYVATVAQTGLPPILVPACYNELYKNTLVGSNFTQPIAFDRFCYEGHQPPLFYYLAAPFYALGGGSLLVLRLLCAAIGALVPALAYLIVRRATNDIPLAVASGGLVAVVPQHLAMIGTLNNDALCFAVVALAVWQMGRLLQWQGKVPQREWLWLGGMVGVALLTKTLAWIALPLAGLTVLLRWNQERKSVGGTRTQPASTFWKNSVSVGAIALLLIVPWFTRNTLTYGAWDVMGLQIHDEIAVGQPRTEAEVARRGAWGTFTNGAQTTFNSFWGQFGWMKAPLQAREYQVLWLFHGLALIGWGVLAWQRRMRNDSPFISTEMLLLFGAWVAVNLALLIYYNLEFVQYQGRYLFSALTPIAFFLMAGLGALVPRRWRVVPWGGFIAFLLYLDALAVLERLPGMMNY